MTLNFVLCTPGGLSDVEILELRRAVKMEIALNFNAYVLAVHFILLTLLLPPTMPFITVKQGYRVEVSGPKKD